MSKARSTHSTRSEESTTAEAVLRQCSGGYAPANVDLDVAVAAHKAAVGSDAAMAIRVVLFAKLRTTEHAKRQLEYLESLPLEAWPDTLSYTAEVARDETLVSLRRKLARRQEDSGNFGRVDRPPPGWFVHQIGRKGRTWEWDALMVDCDPDAERSPHRRPRYVWVAITGKHRSFADAEAALQAMMATRH